LRDVEVLSATAQLMPSIFTDDPERFLPVMVIVAPVSAIDGDNAAYFWTITTRPHLFLSRTG
jgi:hypothetical protein